jgi:hypothetical protein
MTKSQTTKPSRPARKPCPPGSSTASTTAAATTPCGCGCGGGCNCGCGCHSHKDGCCKLTCFERPSYFCGQLLSDKDLTLEETYFREKNKLYHRTIDGFGVVCGMRMQCDCHCDGQITIGDGFAIDCCGNDLVICDPLRFDVIGELRKKKWLIEAPEDCCEGTKYQERERGCIIKQCFYIGVCYSEQSIDYVTPYSTECTVGPGPCQPTRIREGVRFEIYDKEPVRPNPLTEIEKRIERCFRVFREGQFAKGLQQLARRILDIVCLGKDDNPRGERKWREAAPLFEELRALFLHQLRICPDHYNCDLEWEVCRVCAPCDDEYRSEQSALECFTKLFELIERYVFSCVLAEFAFLCPEPPEACCVLLGSVEIENGRLKRVINYPRWYLWSFANFFEVLIYTLANEAACGRYMETKQPVEGDEPDRCRDGCCPEIEIDLCSFLKLFVEENRAPEYAALTSVKAIQAVKKSLIAGFDFVKPNGVAPAVFEHREPDVARRLARNLGVTLEPAGREPAEVPDPLSALLANLMHRGTEPLAYFQKASEKGRGVQVDSVTRIMDAPAHQVGLAELEARVAALEKAEAKKRGGKSPEGEK